MCWHHVLLVGLPKQGRRGLKQWRAPRLAARVRRRQFAQFATDLKSRARREIKGTKRRKHADWPVRQHLLFRVLWLQLPTCHGFPLTVTMTWTLWILCLWECTHSHKNVLHCQVVDWRHGVNISNHVVRTKQIIAHNQRKELEILLSCTILPRSHLYHTLLATQLEVASSRKIPTLYHTY